MHRAAALAAVPLIAAVLSLAGTAAAGGPRLHLIGTNLGFRVDARYAVIEKDAHHFVAGDTRTGRERNYTTACGIGGDVQGFHARLLLLDCGGGAYDILDVATGETRRALGT